MLGPQAHGSHLRRHRIAAQKLGRNEVDGRGAKPACHIGAVGPLINLPRRAELNQRSLAHHADPVRHRHGLDLVVRHVEDRRSQLALDAFELKAQFRAKLGVQRGQRLVHQIDGRLADQRPADGDPLHFAAGKRGSSIAELLLDMKQFRYLLDPTAYHLLIHAPRRRAQRKGQIVVDRQMRIKRILLKYERDVAFGRHFLRYDAPLDHHIASIRPLQTGDQAQRRGLSGTGRTKQHDKFAVRDGERKAADRFDRRRSSC